MSSSIHDTKLPIIIVNKYDLGEKYKEIGDGDESTVYSYEDKYAMKTFSLFRAMEWFYSKQLKNKFLKIEAMAGVADPSFRIPIGLLGFLDEQKEGCYTDLVNCKKGRKDFKYLITLDDYEEKLDYILKADSAIKRIHTKNFLIGDIKETNIMIDVENNPIFIDVDNYAYEDFDFDFFPARCECLEKAYQKPAALKDNDIYVFSLMALKLLTKNDAFNCFASPEEINTALMELDIEKEIKNGLQLIFSDSKDKPYFGEVFKK